MEAIRSTILTWRELSSCPGFRVDENPIFWKHVFGELREHEDKSLQPTLWGCGPPEESLNPVKDAHRMADDVLTRVSICFKARYCRVVSGLASSYDADINAKLESILTQSTPLVDEMLAQRPIRLKLDCSRAFKNYYLGGLRLCEWMSDSLPRSRDSIVKTMQDLPGLRYLNFSCNLSEWRYSSEPIPYADGCQLAWKLLGIEQRDPLSLRWKFFLLRASSHSSASYVHTRSLRGRLR